MILPIVSAIWAGFIYLKPHIDDDQGGIIYRADFPKAKKLPEDRCLLPTLSIAPAWREGKLVSADFDVAGISSGRMVYGSDQTWKATGRYE